VSLSKHIRRERGVFSSFASVEVGYGFRTRFWHDMWCGDRPMKESVFFWSYFVLPGIGMP
jgi:hypothetical protein